MTFPFDIAETVSEALKRWDDKAEFKAREIATACFERDLMDLGRQWVQVAEAIRHATCGGKSLKVIGASPIAHLFDGQCCSPCADKGQALWREPPRKMPR